MPHAVPSIPHLLIAQAERRPDAPAILAPGRSPLTYSALWQHVEHIGAALEAAGVQRRDRVALVLPDGPEMALAFLAVTALATCSPLNPAYSGPEFTAYLAHVRASAVILRSGLPSAARVAARASGLRIMELSPIEDGAAGLFTLAGETLPDTRLGGLPGAGDVAMVLNTAGTTARPKVVPLTHANLRASAENIRRALALGESDRCLNVMPLFHVHGLVGALLASLAAGASVVCAPGFSAPEFFRWLATFRPTWYTAVPTIHQAILSEYRAALAEGAGSLRFIRSTSASLAPAVLAELEHVFGAPVIEAYGTTEASMITCNPLPPGVRKSGSVGVVAGPEVSLRDARGHAPRVGESGEIAVRGPTVIAGYEGDSIANETAFADGWFRTGDQGYFDADGYLHITGRIEDTINRGGESISPQEIDAVLMDHPAVAQAIAFAVPHARLGEDVAAAVVLRPHMTATADEIRRFAAGRLASFKVPQQVLVVPSLPHGATGKPLRLGLANTLGLGALTPAARGAPASRATASTPVEDVLTALWARVLGLPEVGRDENFFALGGDSLLATRLLTLVRDALHVEIPFRAFFDTPTVAGMARALVATGPGGPGPPMRPVPRRGARPVSYAQQRLWLLEQLGRSAHAYHLLEVLRLRGHLRRDALVESLTAMAARHEVLRTRLVSVHGQPRQIVDPPSRVPLPTVDLRELPESGRDARVSTLALAEVRRPFDLARGPLLRASLLELADDEHVLLLAMHHLVSDGWSYAIFWRELANLYEAAAGGTPSPLAPLPVQYADYAHWERQWLSDDALAVHLAYWRRQLAGISRLPLPTDRPRPPVRSARGAREPLAIPAALTETLRALGHRQGATLFMTLLAAFQTLLHRYSGHPDVAVGTLVAHRTRPEVESLIGFFVNTLVLRADFSGDPRFQDLLEQVRETALGAYSHQDVPFEKLVEELRPPRDLGHNPLFDVLFIFQNTPRPPLALAGLTVSPLEIDPRTAKFDLTLELTETPRGLEGWFEYSTDLFEPATITRMAGHLRALLEGVAADAGQRISRLALLTPAESSRVVVEWNATAADYPDTSIHALFADQAARTPDAVALMESARRLTYRDLDAASSALAQHLASLGVEPGMMVGLCLPRSLDVVVGLLGILKAGGVYLPLDPAYPRERLGFILDDARVSVVLTRREWTDLFRARGTRCVYLDAESAHLTGPRVTAPDVRVARDDPAYAIYTSGSTGQPKGVVAPHRQVVNRLAWMWRAYPFAPGEVACQKTALSFVDSIWECLGALLQGIPTAIIPDAVLHDPEALVESLAAHRVTRLWLVPSFLRVMLDRFPDLGERLPRLTFWVTSGEAMPLDLYRRFQICAPRATLYNLYGISEVWDVSWYGPHPPDDPLPRVPIGRPIANVQIYLLDQHQRPVPIGIPGEMYVGGAGLALGYLGRPELTAERFLPDPFSAVPGARLYRTGDLARYLPDGNLDFLGRADDQVKLRGYRIEPREVELALEQHPAVRQAAVVAREDLPDDRRLVAYVVTDGESPPTTSALRRFLEPLVPAAMLPAAFVAVDRLPLTPSGKVDRRALPAPERLRPELDEGFVAPGSATEALLARIWAETLGVEQVGVHDNFFELGGHSLLAMQLLSRMQAATHVAVMLPRFFETPTVADIARLIDAAPPEAAPTAIPVIPRRPPLPASVAQEQLWHLHHLPSAAAASNLSYAVRLSGPVDEAILRQSLDTVLRRHEALRTTFKRVDGRVWQVIAPAVDVPIATVDLREMPASARDAERVRLAREAATRPFDLARGPLIRLHLACLEDSEHVLLVTMHHIISDGWSIGIFIEELGTAYHASAAGRPVALPPLPIQYVDFAHWQRRWPRDGALRDQLAYWKRQLRGPLRPLALPADHPRRTDRQPRTARLPFEFPRSLADGLTALSHREGCTLFMTVLAAFATLAHGYTGAEDVRVATFLANRQRRETEGVIGPFADLAILRTDLGGNPTCREILRRVRATTLAAYSHQEFPFAELVENLERERSVARTALSQVMVIWQNAFRLSPRLAEPPLRFLEMDQSGLGPEAIVTTFDIILELRERPQGLMGSCLYNALIFEAPTVRRLLDDFRGVLDSVVAHPEQPLAVFRALRGTAPPRGG